MLLRNMTPGTSDRRRRVSARCIHWLGPLAGGVLLQTAATGCAGQVVSLLVQDAAAGVGLGISSLTQFLVLNLFI
jgi:hypothetical protein